MCRYVTLCCCCWLPGAEDLAVSTRKATGEVAQVRAGPEWEGQRKEESVESSKPGKVVPTGLAQRVRSGGKDT